MSCNIYERQKKMNWKWMNENEKALWHDWATLSLHSYTTVLTWEWETFCLYVFPSFACALYGYSCFPSQSKVMHLEQIDLCVWMVVSFKSYPYNLLPWWKIKLKILYEMHFTIHFLKNLFFETIEQHLLWSFILTFIFAQFYW